MYIYIPQYLQENARGRSRINLKDERRSYQVLPSTAIRIRFRVANPALPSSSRNYQAPLRPQRMTVESQVVSIKADNRTRIIALYKRGNTRQNKLYHIYTRLINHKGILVQHIKTFINSRLSGFLRNIQYSLQRYFVIPMYEVYAYILEYVQSVVKEARINW